MKAAFNGSAVEFVYFMGITENYPDWFYEEMYENVHMNESRYTFWVDPSERRPDYHELILVEDYSVFIRKMDGSIHVTNHEVFTTLYTVFKYSRSDNSGVAAFNEDVIDYVSCRGGELTAEYPTWFYQYFTEAVNLPGSESLLVGPRGDIYVDGHYVFLKNKRDEIREMRWEEFLAYYDPNPSVIPF